MSFEITCPPPPELLAPPPPPPPLPLFLSSWTASRLIPVARHLLYLKIIETIPACISDMSQTLYMYIIIYVDCLGVEFHLPAKLASIPLTLVNYALLIFATHICQFFSHRSLEKTFAALTTIHTYCKKK